MDEYDGYIEREALLHEVGVMPLDWEYGRAVEDIYNMIKAMPAADVAPVIRGTWQLLRHDKHSDVYQCSQCGRKVSLTHGRGVAEHYPYCHCGARMSEGPAL